MASLLFMLTALSGLGHAGTTARPVEPASWGEFSRFQARHSPITVTVGTVPGGVSGHPVYWAKRVGWTEGGATDSVRCPALTAVVESMRQLSLPSAVPGDPEVMIGDGTMYTLTIPSSYHPPHSTNLDKLTITSAGGPLGEWIEGAMANLEACWLPK